jgi:hypothetical protein
MPDHVRVPACLRLSFYLTHSPFLFPASFQQVALPCSSFRMSSTRLMMFCSRLLLPARTTLSLDYL